MSIKLTLRKQVFHLDGTPPIQVKTALRQLNLSPEAHLLVRNGELLNENDWLKDGDEVKIVAVISGGCSASTGVGASGGGEGCPA